MGGYGQPQPKKRKSKKGDDSDPDEVRLMVLAFGGLCLCCVELCTLVLRPAFLSCGPVGEMGGSNSDRCRCRRNGVVGIASSWHCKQRNLRSCIHAALKPFTHATLTIPAAAVCWCSLTSPLLVVGAALQPPPRSPQGAAAGGLLPLVLLA